MMRRLILATIALTMMAVAVEAQTPAGWKQRLDRSTSASDPDANGTVKFITMGNGLHATNPQAAAYWSPANTAAGNYTVKATFRLMRPSGHTNYYGLIFGGSDLEGPGQNYLYFMVAQDGTWLLKRRDGGAAPTVAGPTTNAVIRKPGGDGMSVNDVEVRVQRDKIDFVVNGTVVHSTPKTGATAKTDGITGIRVNHLLEVQIDGFSVVKQ